MATKDLHPLIRIRKWDVEEKQRLQDERFNRMGGGKSEIGSNAVTRGESEDWKTNALGFILHP